MENYSHADTIYAGEKFRKFPGTVVVCKVGGFGEGMGKF